MKIPFTNFTINNKKDVPKNDKGIINSDSLFGSSGNLISNYNKQNPIIENIYNTISNDISLLNFKHIKKNEEEFEVKTNSNLNQILTIRTNDLQSPSEFWQSFTYNLIKYGNGIAIPIYENETKTENIVINDVNYTFQRQLGKKIKSIENLDVSEMKFGFGYDDKDNVKYLLYKKVANYSQNSLGTFGNLTNNEDDELHVIPYKEVIHVRNIPSNIFNGDQPVNYNFNQIVDVIDNNINTMLSQLNSGGQISGILKVNNGMGAESGKENKLIKFVNSFLNNNSSNIAMLDSNEEFEPLTKAFKTIEKEDIDGVLDYLYKIFGVNSKIINGDYTSSEFSSYYNHTLEPIIKKIDEEINYKLFTHNEIKNGNKILVNKKLIIGADLGEITNFIDKSIYNGITNANEVRELLGFEPYNEGNTYYSNLNAIPQTENGQSTEDISSKENKEEVKNG